MICLEQSSQRKKNLTKWFCSANMLADPYAAINEKKEINYTEPIAIRTGMIVSIKRISRSRLSNRSQTKLMKCQYCGATT